MPQLDIKPDGIDIAGSYQYPPAAPFPPNWSLIKADGIRWVCHKATEGQTFPDRWFEPFWLDHGLQFRYRGAYAWPRTDSGSFVSQMMRTIEWIYAIRGHLAGDFLMADVEHTRGVRDWTPEEVREGLEATERAWGAPVLLYGGYSLLQHFPDKPLVYANWTQAPNIPGTVVRQIGGGIINGISSSGPSVDIDYIVDVDAMDRASGYTTKRKAKNMWIADVAGDLFLCETTVWAITLWDLNNNPDVISTLAAQGGKAIPVSDTNTADRIRARAAANEGGGMGAVVPAAAVRSALAGMKVTGSIVSVPGGFSGTLQP